MRRQAGWLRRYEAQSARVDAAKGVPRFRSNDGSYTIFRAMSQPGPVRGKGGAATGSGCLVAALDFLMTGAYRYRRGWIVASRELAWPNGALEQE
jgi:hypothetical protein